LAPEGLQPQRRGDGGLIVVDWKGRMAWGHSTLFMPVGFRAPSREFVAEPAAAS